MENVLESANSRMSTSITCVNFPKQVICLDDADYGVGIPKIESFSYL